MLAIQEKLRSGIGLEFLCLRHNLSAVEHPELPLVILNYTLDSKKDDAIANECRGLVLEKGSWNVIAKAFNRFFNYGERPDQDQVFDWSTATSQEKIDGSLILIYWYAGKWRVNTRKSFGQGNIAGTSYSWEELVRECVPNLEECGQKERTYVCELVSPYTQVVKFHAKPKVFLLTSFLNYISAKGVEICSESDTAYMDAMILGLDMPEVFEFNSPEIAKEYFSKRNEKDFEGFVFVDKNFNRLKLKNEDYVILHHLKNNNHAFLLHNLVKIVLSGEGDEVCTYFPSERDKVRSLEDRIAVDKLACCNFWVSLDKSLTRKEIADRILKGDFKKFYGVFFKAVDCKDLAFNEVWEKSTDFLEKVYSKEFKMEA